MRRMKVVKFTLSICLIVISLSACVSRLSRPEISGVVVDYDNKPIANCKVGEATTDANGRFVLPERRYNAFLLTEIFVMEAPPLMIFEPIEKSGFIKDAISEFNSRGGGKPKGAKYVIDTIMLRKINQQFDVPALLENSNWKLSYTKNADTIFLVKDGYQKWCKTERCKGFYGNYEVLTDNYYYKGVNNLPKGMIKRYIDISFNKQKSPLQITRINQYDSTFDGPNVPPDTLKTQGNWNVVDNKFMQLNIDKMKEISGKFKLSDIDLYQLKLIKAQ